MSYVGDKLKNRPSFPLEVFPEKVKESIQTIAEQYSIPADLLAASALFAVAALAGNIYVAKVNGGVKPILYIMMVAPSGVGKTPAYKKMCGEIINPLRGFLNEVFKQEQNAWKERKKAAKELGKEFTELQPFKRVRIIEDATLEATLRHAESSPAGFGLFYDEGGRLFSGVTQYRKDASPVDFLNENWNGQAYESIRADSDKDRFIANPAISILIGMQKERMAKYFTEDVLHSGLANRFLICQGDFKQINEAADFFDENRKEVCQEWRDLIRGLFHRGAEMTAEQSAISVEFTLEAKIGYNNIMSDIAGNQNKLIKSLKREDENMPLVAANAKLQAYVARLALVLSIIDNYTGPTITEKNVKDAYSLYKFFKRNSDRILLSLNSTATTGLTESEAELLEALPDQEFTSKQAEEVCISLDLGKKFFFVSFKRKYSKGWVKIIQKGVYEKV